MLLLSCFSLSAFAVDNNKLTTTNIKDGDVEYLSDGSYIVTTITSEETTLIVKGFAKGKLTIKEGSLKGMLIAANTIEKMHSKA